jgi:large subunit ribosomal protein L40e
LILNHQRVSQKRKVNNKMPILDPVKKAIAQQHRLHMKICRDCGARNAATALKCRKCKGKNLRWKKREIVK